MIVCGWLMKRLGPGVTTLGVLAIAASFAVGSLAVAPARAADLPAPAPGYYPPAYAPALYDWTGFYIGGHVGGGMPQDTFTQNGASPTTPATNLFDPIEIHPAGVVGGGQIGANFQFSSWVVGAEALWSATSITGSGTVLTSAGIYQRMTTSIIDFAAATGRIGYAFNSFLPYVKAGGGWMQVHYTQDALINLGVAFPAPAVPTQEIKDMRSGFTAGFGVEYGLTESFSAKLEYDFYDFGTKNYNFATTPLSIQSYFHVVEFGLNYRFNWGH
jgi:outer membrane immunogenic protein